MHYYCVGASPVPAFFRVLLPADLIWRQISSTLGLAVLCRCSLHVKHHIQTETIKHVYKSMHMLQFETCRIAIWAKALTAMAICMHVQVLISPAIRSGHLESGPEQ